ncbi:hypothetical protein G6F55_001461 [Rhizopus delemar]|uniref:UvrD-like helicase C-terminal domain-containing protein n=2 Tax=Rhizopus TaxID=4842 RepID=A0A9P7CRT1_9FUNG|nr:hypothetical protein G6F36_013003 [Rhizopus arrhizus]KAG1464934.1 hypothetical protein G6F55_001461 [Rhizopus delemar]KAG1495701.1 hypothetical protein G6F54_006996 [Rhizopus delemar]KAG1512365.1 hypothetical protein G6F53_005240 [Rhizopus delemar]KAG1523550.1 hypothetical protein G6F52_004931 [Rhizopus delemar]
MRNHEFDESVVSFINKRSVHKSQLSLSCLRLYTTRQRAAVATEKSHAEFPGEGQGFQGDSMGTIDLIEYMEEENICLKKRLPNENDAIYWIQRISRQVPGTRHTRTQFPIVPVFAITIHKAQSAIIDCVGIHLDNMLSHGQIYVAMSCVRKLEALRFLSTETPLNVKRKLGVDIDAVEIIRKEKRI